MEGPHLFFFIKYMWFCITKQLFPSSGKILGQSLHLTGWNLWASSGIFVGSDYSPMLAVPVWHPDSHHVQARSGIFVGVIVALGWQCCFSFGSRIWATVLRPILQRHSNRVWHKSGSCSFWPARFGPLKAQTILAIWATFDIFPLYHTQGHYLSFIS